MRFEQVDVKRASEKMRLSAQLRDLALYLLIAVIVVGAEVVGLLRGWPGPSLRIATSVFSTIVIAVYLIKVFKTKWRSIAFWLLLIAILSIHVSWSLVAPFLLVVVGMGIELLLFGLLIRRFL